MEKPRYADGIFSRDSVKMTNAGPLVGSFPWSLASQIRHFNSQLGSRSLTSWSLSTFDSSHASNLIYLSEFRDEFVSYILIIEKISKLASALNWNLVDELNLIDL